MGTYSGFRTRAEAIAEGLGVCKNTRRAAVGNHIWFVIDIPGAGKPAIGLLLVSRYGPGNWAYKPVDECSGPYYVTCPQSILDAVPDPQEGYSTRWRAACARYRDLLKAFPGRPKWKLANQALFEELQCT